MAFLQGSASDTNDLMSQVSTFLQGNGYSLVRNQDQVINTVTVKTTTLQCPDNSYITFMSTNTIAHPFPVDPNESYVNQNDGWYSSKEYSNNGWWTQAFYAAQHGHYADNDELPQNARPWMGAIRHIDYDASKPWFDQPNAKRVYYDDGFEGSNSQPNINSYSAIAAGDNIANFFVFVNTNPDCVHIVTEYTAGEYSHLTFGNLAKSHNFVGGEYIQGSVRTLGSNMYYAGYLGCIEIGQSNILSGLFSGGVRCEGDGSDWYLGQNYQAMQGWGRVLHVTGIHGVSRAGFNVVYSEQYDQSYIETWERYDLSNRDVGGMRLPMIPCWGASDSTTFRPNENCNPIKSTYDNATGQAAPIPLCSFCEYHTGGAVYLGSWVHVAVVYMDVLSGKEELNIGGEVYQVFPMNKLVDGAESLEIVGATTNGTFIKDADELTPEANCYRLGLAIRKVV